MQRGLYEVRSKRRKVVLDETVTWLELVRKYQGEAAWELSTIYRELTCDEVFEGRSSGDELLATPKFVYIFNTPLGVVYGPNELPYPVEDTSRWPFVRKSEIIKISNDAWMVVASFLDSISILKLSCVNLNMRRIMREDVVWRIPKQRFLERFPVLQPWFQDKATWIVFVNRLFISTADGNNRSKLNNIIWNSLPLVLKKCLIQCSRPKFDSSICRHLTGNMGSKRPYEVFVYGNMRVKKMFQLVKLEGLPGHMCTVTTLFESWNAMLSK